MVDPKQLKCNLCGSLVDALEYYCTECGEDLDHPPANEDELNKDIDS